MNEANDFIDPLDERDADAQRVRDKRLLEELDEQQQIEELARLLEDEKVRDFLWKVIGWCAIFKDPMHSNFGHVAYGLGQAAIGKRLLVEINRANPKAWLSMQLKAAEVAHAEARADALKKLRKGRSS